MKMITHKICIIMSFISLVLLIGSVVFSTTGKGISESNINTEDLVPLFYISDARNIELQYPVQNEKVSGVILYFDIYQTDDSETVYLNDESGHLYGTINYRVLNEEKNILYEGCLDVKEILSMKKEDKIVGTELEMDLEKYSCQVISIVLSGENIPSNIKIRLLGNNENASKLVLANYGIGYAQYPLYQMEVEVSENPYTWDLLLILLLFIIGTILTEENENDTEKDKDRYPI